MSETKPYIGYEFTGISPLTESLYKFGIDFSIIQDPKVPGVFEAQPDILNEETDAIRVGQLSREGKVLYFAEFGLMLGEIARSYVTFIFDHHPSVEEMAAAAGDIEALTLERLKTVQGQGDIPAPH
ncbi:MAG TPA: hypothetical protein PK544_08845 [Spirochaetota bacterium]|nr:hypothetical protein [Spirochaetota bacterium]HPJ38453.1 hypothetical protein [Spirochaetota bacterium]HPQ54233.1 hypothetical protein [Spirochaetota bacterium]